MLVGDGELPDHIRDFFARYPVDERAQGYLLNSPESVIDTAVKEFKPKVEGEADYSGLLTSYIKRLRSRCPAQAAPNGGGDVELGLEFQEAIEDFVQRYPVDEGAYSFLTGSPPHVISRVLKEFRPKSEGDNDYSAIVMTFVKRCRADQRGALVHETSHVAPMPQYTAPPSQTECSRFFEKYPVDERALDYFDMSPTEVQWKVIGEFKPKVEGESDYSGLLTSFCKKWRNNISQDMAREPFVQHARGPVASSPAFGGKGFGKGFGPSMGSPTQMFQPGGPTPLDFEAFRNRFPMDERAFSYLTSSSPEVADRVLASFVPPRLNDTDFSAPITAYVKQCRKQLPSQGAAFGPVGAHPGPFSAAGFGRPPLEAPRARFADSGPRRGKGGKGGGPDVRGFFARYPCDERATDYLCSQSPEVIDRVLSQFVAKREGDADYSAIVMSFTKRCANDGGGPPSGGVWGGGGGHGQDAQLQGFLQRYPCDERATDFLCTQPPEVVDQVLREFVAKREGESDYSAIVMSFTKRCRDGMRGSGGYGDAYAPPWKRVRT